MSAGMNMMLASLLKNLNIDPEEIKKQIAGFVQIAVNADKRLTALETQAARIEAKLNLLLDAKGLDYGGVAEIDLKGAIGGAANPELGNSTASD